jgi:hypothetical protein
VEELTAEEIRHLIEANAAKQGVVAFAEALRLSTRWVPESYLLRPSGVICLYRAIGRHGHPT